MIRHTTLPLLASLSLALAGCDVVQQRLGIEDPAQKEAKADAEGRAVGSACRQSGRAIEDCYSVYQWLPKASVFAGWREMNDYMLANKLEVVEPKLPPAPPPPEPGAKKKKKATAADSGEKKADDSGKDGAKPEAPAEKTVEKAGEKAPEKPAEKAGSKH